jgi:hypothetical protein
MFFAFVTLAVASFVSERFVTANKYAWAVGTYFVSFVAAIYFISPANFWWGALAWFIYSCLYSLEMIVWGVAIRSQ